MGSSRSVSPNANMNPKWGSKAGSYHRQTDKEEEEDRTGFTLAGDQKQEGEETRVHRQEVNTIKLKQEITNKQILNILNSYTKHGIKSNPANSIIWFFWTALSKVKKVKMNPKFKQIQKKVFGHPKYEHECWKNHNQFGRIVWNAWMKTAEQLINGPGCDYLVSQSKWLIMSVMNQNIL